MRRTASPTRSPRSSRVCIDPPSQVTSPGPVARSGPSRLRASQFVPTGHELGRGRRLDANRREDGRCPGRTGGIYARAPGTGNRSRRRWRTEQRGRDGSGKVIGKSIGAPCGGPSIGGYARRQRLRTVCGATVHITRRVMGEFKPCRVGLKACGGAHNRARVLRAMGHGARLTSPQSVKADVKSNQNEFRDEEGICEAVARLHWWTRACERRGCYSPRATTTRKTLCSAALHGSSAATGRADRVNAMGRTGRTDVPTV